jgi:hypothetical protein
MELQPAVNALIASFLALGMAGGENYLQRAGKFLRDLERDPAVDSGTRAIIRNILVAADCDGRN